MDYSATSNETLLAINNYFYRRGGAEAVFFDHMNMFSKIGWSVVPFAMEHEKNEPSDWSDYFVSEIEYGNDGSPLRRVIQAANIIYSCEARQNIERLAEKTKPTVAHAHNVYHHLSPAIFSKLKDLGIPVVMTAHDLKLACPSYKMLRNGDVCEKCHGGHIYNVLRYKCIKESVPLSGLVLLETFIHRLLGLYRHKIDRIAVPSKFYIDKLEQWGWPREKMAYVPNFIDLTDYTPSQSEADYFIFAGRLAPEKGIETLIRAIAQSGQKLLIAGTGPEETKLKQLALSLEADVTFTGYLSGKKLHEAIGLSKALVLPSEWYENAPISILEAYALERPVIGSAIGGIPEMIKDGDTGYIFEAKSVNDLAQKLSVLSAKSPRDRQQMGQTARRWVADQFSAAAYQERTLKLYNEIRT